MKVAGFLFGATGAIANWRSNGSGSFSNGNSRFTGYAVTSSIGAKELTI